MSFMPKVERSGLYICRAQSRAPDGAEIDVPFLDAKHSSAGGYKLQGIAANGELIDQCANLASVGNLLVFGANLRAMRSSPCGVMRAASDEACCLGTIRDVVASAGLFCAIKTGKWHEELLQVITSTPCWLSKPGRLH